VPLGGKSVDQQCAERRYLILVCRPRQGRDENPGDNLKFKTARRMVGLAKKNPLFGNLDRIQIVKGWVDDTGKGREQIYDVVWSDADRRQPGADGRLPPVGDTVDVATATWRDTIGEPGLQAVWTDPDFDPDQPAFYYARVIEIPTPRWTAWDQARFGVEMSDEVPMTHQERAWTSPIWYAPR
jgi:hypothetical protein